ncbi:hypothetical protein SLE2022_177510 [Rubroshorea leprosula]
MVSVEKGGGSLYCLLSRVHSRVVPRGVCSFFKLHRWPVGTLPLLAITNPTTGFFHDMVWIFLTLRSGNHMAKRNAWRVVTT